MESDHYEWDHAISGSPHERMRRIVARHLCRWISGHSAPADHFLADADLILAEAHEQGIRFHLVDPTRGVNPSDGYIDVRLA